MMYSSRTTRAAPLLWLIASTQFHSDVTCFSLTNTRVSSRGNVVGGQRHGASSSVGIPLQSRKQKYDEDDEGQTQPRKGRVRINDGFEDADTSYAREAVDDNAAARLLESSIGFLLGPVTIFDYRLPLVVPLAGVVSIAVLPPVTWFLSTVLFGLYFWLGNALLLGGDAVDDIRTSGEDINNNPNRYDDDNSEDDVGREIIFPLASYCGAVASAALLSPQGLVIESDAISFASPWFAVSFGLGLALLVQTQLNALGNEEQILEMKERQERMTAAEKMRMDRWDDELDGKSAERDR